jgi:hypothetical protein
MMQGLADNLHRGFGGTRWRRAALAALAASGVTVSAG